MHANVYMNGPNKLIADLFLKIIVV